MLMRDFFEAFPEMAARETRLLQVSGDSLIPAGDYTLKEYYCEDPRCDCRNGVINVVGQESGWVASLSYSLEDGSQAKLDPAGPEGEVAQRWLNIVRLQLTDPAYIERLRRHYRLVKNRHLSWSPPWESNTKLKRKLLRKAGRC